MDCQHIEHHIVDYIDGQMSTEISQQVKNHIASCNNCRKIYDETKALFSAFDNLQEETPSNNLRTEFYKILEEEKQLLDDKVVQLPKKEKAFPWKQAFQIAASILFMLGGYVLGSHSSRQTSSEEISALQQEKVELREGIMLAMIENQSPSKRIQAVNFTESFTKPDTKILEALIERMQYDGNTNVRLAAAEALSEFPDSAIVKDAFIEALTTQKDPSLQIAIIQFLVKIQEKRAIIPMKELLKQNETQPYVKDEIESSLSNII